MRVGSDASGRLDSSGTVQIASGATLTGLGQIAGSVLNNGTIAAVDAVTPSASRQNVSRAVVGAVTSNA